MPENQGIPGRKSPSVTMSPAPVATVTRGKANTVNLRFHVSSGFHVNSNKPKSEFLIPTALKLSAPTDIVIGRVSYPPAKEMSFAFAPEEKLSVYTGEFPVAVEVRPLASVVTSEIHDPGRTEIPGLRQCRLLSPQEIAGTVRGQGGEGPSAAPQESRPEPTRASVMLETLSRQSTMAGRKATLDRRNIVLRPRRTNPWIGFPERKQQHDETGTAEFLPAELLSPRALPDPDLKNTSSDSLPGYIAESVLRTLPNDLTRMIYLASLRDCNSGLYLHPELSRQRVFSAADRALRACHEQVFRRLLTTRLPDYVSQLQEYIRYTRGETITMLNTWRSLQAYRATVPVGTASISAELFFLNISVALEILGQRMPELQPQQS